MKIQQLIKETPLPDDWDKQLYQHGSGSFKKRIEYAKEKAKRVGGGSSRVAFKIQYQGRDTVLKIAKNKKGLAQNYQESMMLRTADMLGASGTVVVPEIDHDETGEDPSWIHVEYARKLKSEQEFKRLTGYELSDLLNFAAKTFSNKSIKYAITQEFSKEWSEKLWEEDTWTYEFLNFVGNTDLHLPDLYRYSNWGVYKNNPVIIDLGLSEEVFQSHYAR